MLENEEVRKAVSYITGKIKLEFHPPNGFPIEPTVTIDGKVAVVKFVKSSSEDDPLTWKYLAIVEKGVSHKVEVSFGEVTALASVEAKGGQATIQDFRFSSSE